MSLKEKLLLFKPRTHPLSTRSREAKSHVRSLNNKTNGRLRQRKFIWNYFLAFQSGSQTRNERSGKQRVPIRIKRCATSAPPLSPCPFWADSICVFRDRKAFGRAIVDWRRIPLKFSLWGWRVIELV
ncbi:hypothetical protein CEXT_602921 [Caerostris extrusa]|uniref:Ribosomal protein S14 n=1 Tax=Caerostris extrusa TaxID=172846 RepID=A0AAV4U6I1_CAEEX|nr:hypothetical protein CEXT_602921 [Caerostris extrusa]